MNSASVMKRGEFELIKQVFAPLARDPGAFGLGDDAAILPPREGHDLVVTTDAMVEGVHFLGDVLPRNLAAKLLRVNLSDLAAMGAEPAAYVLTCGLNAELLDIWIEEFAEGLAEDQDVYGITLVGGDTVAVPDHHKFFSVTMFGHVATGVRLRRAGAKVGDDVYVSGTIADALIGHQYGYGRFPTLDAAAAEYFYERFQRPSPRLKLGRRLHGLAHAATDISDGLIADLGHICEQSGVGAVVREDDVPLSDAARTALPMEPETERMRLVWGDDYELVFTADPARADEVQRLAAELGLALTAVGTITDEPGVRVIDAAGDPVHFESGSGYRHF